MHELPASRRDVHLLKLGLVQYGVSLRLCLAAQQTLDFLTKYLQVLT